MDADVARARARAAKQPKSKYQIVEVNPLCRVWIYIVADRGTGKIIYVGQTVDTGKRWSQHVKKLDTGLQDYCLRKSCTFDRLKISIVSQLPNGVAQCDADRWEAYFISLHQTLFDPRNNRDAANNTNGNRARKVDCETMDRELEIGYVWPKAMEKKVEQLKQAAPELEQARAMVDVLETIMVQNPKLEEQVRTKLVIAENQMSKLEMGVYEHAKRVFERYDAMQGYAQITRNELVAELNGVGAMDETVRDGLRTMILKMHPDKEKQDGAVILVPSGFCCGIMKCVLEWAGQKAESNLNLDTNTARRCLELREWSAQNQRRVPSNKALGRQVKKGEKAEDLNKEESLGVWIKDWRGPYGRPSPNTVLVLLRHFPLLIAKLLGESQSDKSDAIVKELNAKLRAGFGHVHESETDPSIQKLPYTSSASNPNATKVLLKLHGFLSGQNASEADKILEGLPEERATRLRKQHEDKIEERKKTLKESGQKQIERIQKRRAERDEEKEAKKNKV